MHDDLDYGRLKKALEFFVEQYLPANLSTGDSNPVRLLKCDEGCSMATARQRLFVALGDFVEATQGYSLEHVLAADSALETRGAYSLSLLRSRFGRRNKA